MKASRLRSLIAPALILFSVAAHATVHLKLNVGDGVYVIPVKEAVCGAPDETGFTVLLGEMLVGSEYGYDQLYLNLHKNMENREVDAARSFILWALVENKTEDIVLIATKDKWESSEVTLTHMQTHRYGDVIMYNSIETIGREILASIKVAKDSGNDSDSSPLCPRSTLDETSSTAERKLLRRNLYGEGF